MRILSITAAFLAASLAPVLVFGQGFTGDINSKPPARRPPAQRRELQTASRTSAVYGSALTSPTCPRPTRTRSGTPELPFTEAGMKAWKAYDAANGDYTGSCLPFGLMRSMNSPDPIQIMQNPKYIALALRAEHLVSHHSHRQEHDKDVLPTWFGDSVGTGMATPSWWTPSTSTAARAWIPSAIRTATPCMSLSASRAPTSTTWLRSDHRRPQDFHQDLDQQANLHAADGLGNHGVLVRREQQGSLRGPHQGAAAS